MKPFSKTIENHPAVAACNDGVAEGFDYKYDVELKPDFVFNSGRMKGCNNARFHTVKEFLAASIVRITL